MYIYIIYTRFSSVLSYTGIAQVMGSIPVPA